MATPTHYDTLGVQPTAQPGEIRRAYVELARRYHPDFHAAAAPSVQQEAAARMRAINEAWGILGQPGARTGYDRKLRSTGRLPVPDGARGATATATATATRPGPAGPEPASGHVPSKLLQMAPAALLALALVCFAIGFITGLVPVLLTGFIAALAGGAAFIIAPIITAARSTND